MPDWLTPFPQARELTSKATVTEATSAYKAPALPVIVTAYYAQQLRAAGIEFASRQDAGPD